MNIKTLDVVYRKDLYPRIKHDPLTVQKYAEDLSVLPAIEINQHNELIDGWHRWTAHKKNEEEFIDVITTKTLSDADFLEKAIERNSAHGLQLSQQDKKDMARKIYHITPEKDRDEKKKTLSKILSVSERTVRGWLSRIDKDSKEARNNKIFDLWMQCYTRDEIAELTNTSTGEVSAISSKMADLPNMTKSDKSKAEHATDFKPPIYNIWKQQSKSNSVNHFGNTEQQWLDNLLYLYTNPFDIVVDPFAGGGSTIDVCKNRFRRYFVSDRKPIIEREEEIRKHDITNGLPLIPRWKDVKLVYLDPPYWKQAENKYSEDKEDLANQSIDEFNKNIINAINGFAKKLKGGGNSYISLIIQPTQWKNDNKEITDHIADMIKTIKHPIESRYSVPYETQQYTPQMVNWAKENKKCLVLTREIIVWKIM